LSIPRVDASVAHGSPRILIVDDNVDAAHSGRILLENAEHVVRSRAAGFDLHLTKPADMALVVAAIAARIR
jgi:CheY-like chemotaxis protein